MPKEYTVVKDGAVLKTYKSLPASKKLADEHRAEVICDGEVVYKAEPSVTRYRLKARMNIRDRPSLDGSRVTVWPEGKEVEVLGIRDDWMEVKTNMGTAYILYGDGQYAEPAE